MPNDPSPAVSAVVAGRGGLATAQRAGWGFISLYTLA
jgi:hypothetical protein